MREIKFRAWDIIFKRFTKQVSSCASFTDRGNEGKLNIREGIVLLQYTGLKDKNGVDGYENDLIKRDGFIGIVKFDEGRFYIKWISQLCDFSDTIRFHIIESEVIGNIHENPELLKG